MKSYQAVFVNYQCVKIRKNITGGNFIMSEDFYCEEVLSGRTPVQKVLETEDVLAYHHTRPFYPVHIVTIPKRHIASLLTLEEGDSALLI